MDFRKKGSPKKSERMPVPPRRMKCTEKEFDEFIARYPRELVSAAHGAYEPPLVTFNDFTLGDWPASIVANYSMGYYPDDPPRNNFYILESK